MPYDLFVKRLYFDGGLAGGGGLWLGQFCLAPSVISAVLRTCLTQRPQFEQGDSNLFMFLYLNLFIIQNENKWFVGRLYKTYKKNDFV